MKPVPVKHFTPSIGVTMSELLVQADAIRLDGAGANRFASQHQDSVSLASNFVPNVPSLDSVFSKVGVPQQKRLEGKNEAMRKARLRKFAKKSEPCNDLLEFSLNGTRYSKTTVEGQNSFDDHRLPVSFVINYISNSYQKNIYQSSEEGLTGSFFKCPSY